MRSAQVIIIGVACYSLIVGVIFGGYIHSELINSEICYGCMGLQPKTPLFQIFWVEYPSGHIREGLPVPHSDWIRAVLKEKVVFIFLWQTGCKPCDVQWIEMKSAGIVKGEERNGEISDEYKESIALFSLDVGTNQSEYDAMKIYNPYGKNFGTPTTIVLTLIYNNTLNKVEIGWFSFIGPTGGAGGQPTVAQLKNILDVAVFYHHKNRAQWNDLDKAS